MIRLRRPLDTAALSLVVQKYLARRQRTANGYAIGSRTLQNAWNYFLTRPEKADLHAALQRLSHGKCAYCEQTRAPDIEHFYPKSTYPTRMYLWSNLLPSCKDCNLAKLDHFPMSGNQPVLIDPSSEEPMDFFSWSFETGEPVLRPNEPYHTRAKETIETLPLEQLSDERRIKLLDVLYLLANVVKENPITVETADRLHDHLLPSRPWLAVIRQLFLSPGKYEPLVTAAFAKLPTIHQWIAGWI